MQKNNLFIFLLACLIYNATGCKKEYELNTTGDMIIDEAIFSSPETVIKSLTTIYAEMAYYYASSYYNSYFGGLCSDEFIPGNEDIPEVVQLYRNKIDPASNNYTYSYWKAAYSYIYHCNAIIEGCAKSTKLSQQIKVQMTAEALFIRSYWYFNLVNLWGDVPLALTTNVLENANLFRSPKELVYKQIIQDLLIAKDGLTSEYLSHNSMVVSNERNRPNKMVAIAQLAKVYLYIGNYIGAEEMASTLIRNTAIYQLEPLEKVFLTGSRETIWSLAGPYVNQTTNNTFEAYNFILTEHPFKRGRPYLSSHQLMAFEAGDKRRQVWIGRFSDSTSSTTYYYPFKYKVQWAESVQEHTTLFRLSEQYLIRAEARAGLGKHTQALSDLNKLRLRAGLMPLNSSSTDMTFKKMIKIILKERQTELFTEGHRWLDLKRTSYINDVMQIISSSKNSTWRSEMQNWPISTIEMENAPNIKQTPGY